MAAQRDKQTGFETARAETGCTDVWPPCTCTREVMLAYKELDQKGCIRLHMPIEVSRHTGRVIIRYESDIPHDWILKELKELKERYMEMGEQLTIEGVRP